MSEEKVEGAKEKEATQEKKGFFDRTIGKFSLPLLTFVLGICATLFTSWYNNRLATIYYSVTGSSGVIQRPELGGKNFQIVIDGQPVENISTGTVYLFNPSSKDLADLPVYITLKMPDGSAPKLIQSQVQLRPEQFETIAATTQSTKEARFGYKLKVVNRQDTAVFQANYSVEGNAAPIISVDVDKLGVQTEAIDPSRLTQDASRIHWVPLVVAIFGIPSLFITFIGILPSLAKKPILISVGMVLLAVVSLIACADLIRMAFR